MTPSPCYPPNYMNASNFQPGYGKVRYYSPGVCSSGYEIALSWEDVGKETGTGTGEAAKSETESSSRETTTAICCPGIWNEVAEEIIHSGYFVKGVYLSETCHSEAALFTGTVYNIRGSSRWVESGWSVSSTVIGSTVTSLYPGTDMDTTVSAAGIVIMRSDGDPEWRNESQEEQSSLKTLGRGAVAGIATGVAGLVLLGSITAAIIIGKKRRKQAAGADRRPGYELLSYSYDSTRRKAIYPQAAELADGQPVGAEMGIEGARVSPGTLGELDAIRPPGELQTVERPVEVPGTDAGRALELPA